MQNYTPEQEIQITRLEAAKVYLMPEQIDVYLESPDTLDLKEGDIIPPGYKRCGHCHLYKKLYMFNKNKGASNNCTGNCKECQKETSKKSYDANKGSTDHKAYYEANREKKLAHSQVYYSANKEKVLTGQKKYHQTSKGKKAMKGSHAKRKYLMNKNAGIPWTEELIIDRDKEGGDRPICVLCDKPVMFDRDIHMEHLIPIVIGGPNCFTNVGVAHALCNLQKSKDAREIETERVDKLIARAEVYMEEHKDKFPSVFNHSISEK